MGLWRKRSRLHSLKRPKIRQDMKKETLYNLAKMRAQMTDNRSFFQQKWSAKAMTRAYHGEMIREGLWTRMFDRSADSVMPMNPEYLAREDGSKESSGRGMGREQPEQQKKNPRIPYMQMVYHPTERRLDTAIYRALFASSSRQARQFVTHGHVKVNGKPMRHPGYMLNPGDLFQVDPDSVMFALGAKKEANTTSNAVANLRADEAAAARATEQESAAVEEEAEEEDLTEEIEALSQLSIEDAANDADALKDTKSQLKRLRADVKTLLETPPAGLTNKTKQALRALSKEVRSSMSKATSLTPSDLEDLNIRLEDLKTRAGVSSDADAGAGAEPDADAPATKTAEEEQALSVAVREAQDNPFDPSKPYATPWRPRPFLPAFAFVPRYLEVNHKICAAVYVRHPVASPGLAEVPTPFAYETGQLAYNWYLKRR